MRTVSRALVRNVEFERRAYAAFPARRSLCRVSVETVGTSTGEVRTGIGEREQSTGKRERGKDDKGTDSGEQETRTDARVQVPAVVHVRVRTILNGKFRTLTHLPDTSDETRPAPYRSPRAPRHPGRRALRAPSPHPKFAILVHIVEESNRRGRKRFPVSVPAAENGGEDGEDGENACGPR